jgi:hypothetical protein
MAFRSWQDLVREPQSERHVLQLYREPGFLQAAVSAWAAEALAKGGAAILVGAPENVAPIEARLAAMGHDPAALRRAGRLVVVDGDALMHRFMVEDMPDADAFRGLASEIIGRARAACEGPNPEVRAWGEMVNLLFHRGNLPAAQRLESLWNDVIDAERIRLMCSYAIDNLAPETHAGLLGHVCAGHSQLMPEPDYDRLERAVGRALLDVFGEAEAGIVRTLFANKRPLPIGMPPAEALLVALQATQPDLGRRVLVCTRVHFRNLGSE